MSSRAEKQIKKLETYDQWERERAFHKIARMTQGDLVRLGKGSNPLYRDVAALFEYVIKTGDITASEYMFDTMLGPIEEK